MLIYGNYIYTYMFVVDRHPVWIISQTCQMICTTIITGFLYFTDLFLFNKKKKKLFQLEKLIYNKILLIQLSQSLF
jgi:hypothetical protein